MKVIITGRKIDITDGLRDYTTNKLSKLDKFFGDEATADVTLSVQKDNHIIEVTIHHNGMIYRAEVSELDMYASIDRVEDVLERQIRKQKTRLEKQLRAGAFEPVAEFGDIEEETEFKVVKTKTYSAGLGLILAGAIGNFVDRIALGYVRDFIMFDFWHSFPIFNFADCCIVIGAALVCIHFIFLSKPDKDVTKNKSKADKDGTN